MLRDPGDDGICAKPAGLAALYCCVRPTAIPAEGAKNPWWRAGERPEIIYVFCRIYEGVRICYGAASVGALWAVTEEKRLVSMSPLILSSLVPTV